MQPEKDYKKLLERLEKLVQKQAEFQREIEQLRQDIHQFDKHPEMSSYAGEERTVASKEDRISKPHLASTQREFTTGSDSGEGVPQGEKTTGVKNNLERFIGENLINKIGIIILVIGVAIGANYAYEHSLLSPKIRIIGGYAAGLILLGLAFRLKAKYENYSAVLISGAMAILYFITYAAFSFYSLIPLSMTFILMLVFTVFTVMAALRYNRQIIAHLGLVGAYALPFLMGRHMNKAEFLFSYMTIINLGILAIAVKKYWKELYYSSFGLTWLIYLVWSVFKSKAAFGTHMSITFLIIFFVIFYAAFLTYKLVQKEKFQTADIVLLLINSFIFYGVGYSIISRHEGWEHYLGLFTLINGAVHGAVSFILYFNKLTDRNLFYLVVGLVLVFITIAIPVQLNGHWVTLLWIGEAAVLFWIGRTRPVSYYETISYVLMLLALGSLVQDWQTGYESRVVGEHPGMVPPIFNINFLGSFLFIAAMAFINRIHFVHKPKENELKGVTGIFNYIIPLLLVLVVFFAFWEEIAFYWNQRYLGSLTANPAGIYGGNADMQHFKSLWLMNYAAFFLIAVLGLNRWKIKDDRLSWLCLSLSLVLIIVFLTGGLYQLSELRASYLASKVGKIHTVGRMNIGIRYISILFFVALLVWGRNTQRRISQNSKITRITDLVIYISSLWLISSELIHWLDMAGTHNLYKLGLSILWGVYALFAIIMGIWKKKAYLRIAAIVLFSVTLLKIFFYDMAHLDKLSRMIIFICLGVLLLIVSFLYARYKQVIFPEESE